MTAEGEGKSDKKDEDLFEDLDKFFAPIQDVDWPENSPAAPPRDEPAPDTAAGEPAIAGPDDASAAGPDRKSTRLNSSHIQKSRMPSSA